MYQLPLRCSLIHSNKCTSNNKLLISTNGTWLSRNGCNYNLTKCQRCFMNDTENEQWNWMEYSLEMKNEDINGNKWMKCHHILESINRIFIVLAKFNCIFFPSFLFQHLPRGKGWICRGNKMYHLQSIRSYTNQLEMKELKMLKYEKAPGVRITFIQNFYCIKWELQNGK